MTTAEITPRDTGAPTTTASYDWIDLVVLFARRLRLLAVAAIVAAAIAAVTVFFLPNVYTARTVILPPQQSQSLLPAVMGQLGSLAGMAGRDLSMRNIADLYGAILQSETIQTELVRRFKLVQLYNERRLVDTRKKLAKKTVVTVRPKEGLIDIEVDDRDPQRAADIANAYVEELFKVNARLALTDASQRRLFFEQEMNATKGDLGRAELNMKQTQETTGLLRVESQATAMIQTVASLKAEIAAKEVQMRAMRTFATDLNPAVVVAQEELSGIRAQLSKVQSQGGGNGDPQIPTKKIPEASLAYMRSLRDLEFQETLYELLAKQYEAARIDEAKSSPLIQVIDRATPPEVKSGPRRILIILAAGLLSIFFAAVAIICKETYHRFASNSDNRIRMAAAKAYLRS